MVELFVYFKEIKLGKLSSDGESFVYAANQNNVKKALEKGYPVWLYNAEKDFESKELPLGFMNLVPEEDSDISKAASIFASDSIIKKLEKIAKLDLFEPDFHIKLK